MSPEVYGVRIDGRGRTVKDVPAQVNNLGDVLYLHIDGRTYRFRPEDWAMLFATATAPAQK